MDEMVKQVEREAIQVVERAEDLITAYTGSAAVISEQIASFIPALPSMPFATFIPAPDDLVKASFGVADRAMQASRRIADSMLEVVAPISSALMPWMPRSTSKRADRKTQAQREAA